MPIEAKLDLPVERVRVSGPAVDALDRRKESNNHKPASSAEFMKSFEKIKDTLFNGLHQLTTVRR